MDEIDGMNSGDKGGMSEINNIISESREHNTPFICISNNVCKKTDALKRKSLYMKIGKPSDNVIKKIITKISDGENLNIQPLCKEKEPMLPLEDAYHIHPLTYKLLVNYPYLH